MSKYEEAFKKIVVAIILLSTGIEIETSQVDLSKMDKDDEIYNIINEAILKAKAFDIIKEKRVNIEHLIFVGRAYNEHKVYATLTDEEFDLIEQALEVE